MSDKLKEIIALLEKNTNKELNPKDTWDLVSNDIYNEFIKLVDIRTSEELFFVGLVPKSTHIAWASGTRFNRNPRFVKEVENKIGKDKVIVLICRSGNRSKLAVKALEDAGFQYVFSVGEGFEGDLNSDNQRSKINGWKFHNLPWLQQ